LWDQCVSLDRKTAGDCRNNRGSTSCRQLDRFADQARRRSLTDVQVVNVFSGLGPFLDPSRLATAAAPLHEKRLAGTTCPLQVPALAFPLVDFGHQLIPALAGHRSFGRETDPPRV
jgi:hypothetical protein